MTEQMPAYAGFWLRLGASIIDTILILLVIMPLLLLFYGTAYFEAYIGFNPYAPRETGAADFIIRWLLPLAAIIAFWKTKSATPGKIWLKMKIVDAKTGGALSTGQCIGRYLGYFLSTLFLLLGFFWVAFDKRKQGWHDKLAGTVVIRTNAEPQPAAEQAE